MFLFFWRFGIKQEKENHFATSLLATFHIGLDLCLRDDIFLLCLNYFHIQIVNTCLMDYYLWSSKIDYTNQSCHCNWKPWKTLLVYYYWYFILIIAWLNWGLNIDNCEVLYQCLLHHRKVWMGSSSNHISKK